MSSTRTVSRLVLSRIVAPIVAIVCQAAFTSLRAQDPPVPAASDRLVSVGIGGGVSVPRQGGTISELRAGMHTQGFVVLRLPAGLPALRFNVDYARQRLVPAAAAPASPADATDYQSELAGVLGTKIDLLHGPVRPYLLAGIGAFSIDEPTVASPSTSRNVSFGLDGGAGLSLRLGPINAFAEARLQNVYTRARGVMDARSIQSVPVTFGISF